MQTLSPAAASRIALALLLGTAPVPAAAQPFTSRQPATLPLPDAAAAADRGPFPEGQAAIRHVLVHIDPGATFATFPIYRDLARWLPREVEVSAVVAADDQQSGARFVLESAGFEPRRITVVSAGEPISVWARDRAIAVHGLGAGATLVTPGSDTVNETRLGDMAGAEAVSHTHVGLHYLPTSLFFEGGNVLGGRATSFVGACGLFPDPSYDDDRALALERDLANDLATRLVTLGEPFAPPHEHLDMYLTRLDENLALLGDPRLGADYLRRAAAAGLGEGPLPDFDEWTEDWQEHVAPRFDLVAAELQKLGVRVERLPLLVGRNGKVLTWNNALVEKREDGRRAYVPVYGIPGLDDTALATYRRLGCKAFPIDAARTIEMGGTVRCLVNVLEWRLPAAH